MSEKLLFGRTKKILLFVTLLLGVAAGGVFGQTLQPGDVAFTGFNADGDDEFAFVSLTDISSGTSLYFTDADWDGSNFGSSEGKVSYTVPSGGLSAGDVVTINPSVLTASDGGNVEEPDAGYDFSGSGDEIYAYLGTIDSPSTFLFALTNQTSWSSADGQVPSSLNDGTTALSGIGGSVDDNGEYTGTREGTVSTLKSEVQKVVNEWTTTDGNNDQSISFNTNSFTILDPPTLAFSSSSASVDEDGATINITVELVESDGGDVSVDVVFLGSSSTSNLSDIDSYSTKTVSFTESPTSGETLNVTINLTDDGVFEGTEKVVLQLQNNSTGSIIEPKSFTLTIKDDDAPDVVINEIMADPGTVDANGDGNSDGSDEEFIEIVNNESEDIDISNWTISDEVGEKFKFPLGSVIPSGNAVVVFADTAEGSNFGGAYLYFAGSLGLNNDSDTITLKDVEGNLINEISYSSTSEGISLNRNPDQTGKDDSFIGHDGISGATTDFTPGTKVNGDPFGSKHAIAVRGTEGWRMISSPVQSASFSDVLSDFWMQGVNNSDDPGGNATLYSWEESGGGTFSAPGNMSENLTPGKGYIVYFFEDDEFNTPGIQGGFPKIIDTDGTENDGPVTATVSATDVGGTTVIDGEEGWNLLGNPFDTDISVTAVLDELESVNSSVNANIQVWDHEKGSGNGGWVTLGDGDLIAPFQAFFVRFTSPFSVENASFDKSELEANEGKEFYKDVSDNFRFDLELHGDQYFDTYSLEFTDDGSTELDRYDAYKLFSLNLNSINLYSTLNNNRLQKNVLPHELESNLEIPLSFDASGRTSLTFRWGSFDNIPDEWDIILIDNKLNREIDLRSNDEYEFTTGPDSEVNDLASSSNSNSLLKTAKQDDGEPRFTLAVQPQIAGSDESEIPESVKLNPNYPNPFNPSTTVSFELTKESEVTLSIWNMIGQKVATLVEGVVEAGTHQQIWNASNMPSGMYIARLEVGGEVFIRKMTLIK